MTRAKRLLSWGAIIFVVLLVSGWLLADHLTPAAVGTPSKALPVQPAETALDREVAPLLARHGGKTGAMLLPDGLDAFAARAISARQAGRTLDLQYYIWHDDLTGRLLAAEAWQAAERGVRVRMLLDDINASGKDEGLLVLDSHPNIELRVYNPFRNRSGPMRMAELVQRGFSLNHRMHNKVWIADNRVAVTGGRNIGDEYFSASPESNFRDLDILLFGPVVQQASDMFDAYWNSDGVVPIAALNRKPKRTLANVLEQTRGELESPQAKAYLDRVDLSPTVKQYASQELTPYWSDAIRLHTDPPMKQRQDDRRDWISAHIARDIGTAEHKAQIVSPYFVPGDEGTAQLMGLARGGAHVGIVTNSLAANDVVAVHSGYARYRERLLRGGVHLYELRASMPGGGESDKAALGSGSGGGGSGSGGSGASGSGSGSSAGGSATNASAFGSSGASLHTKAYVIDDRHGFVGSFNLDPRSADLNTEMGVFFDDPDLARAVRDEYMALSSRKASYMVFLDDTETLRWLDGRATPPRALDTEPDASFTVRASARFLRYLPIESQL